MSQEMSQDTMDVSPTAIETVTGASEPKPPTPPSLDDQPHLPVVRPSSLNWDFEQLLSSSPNFYPVHRVKASLPPDELSAIIEDHEYRGIPLIIEEWHLQDGWNAGAHSPSWLAENCTARKSFWFC
jgi:hypothetical protein